MSELMEKEKEFIKDWEKYRGVIGCLRYLSRWLLLGLVAIPVVLTAINPDIWSTVQLNRLAEEVSIFLTVGFGICVKPALLVGFVVWWRKNRKYKYLLSGSDRHRPLSVRPWKKGELWQAWGITLLFGAPSAGLILISIMIQLQGNRRAACMFDSSSAFLCFAIIYLLFHIFYFQRHDGPLYIHLWAKIIMLLLGLNVIASYLWYNYG